MGQLPNGRRRMENKDINKLNEMNVSPYGEEKTQLMKKISEEDMTFRELPKQAVPLKRSSPKWKKVLIVLGLFFMAIVGGFFAMGYLHDRHQISENEELHHIQSIREQEADIQKKKDQLKQEKQQR